jgi:hypothetical protein
LACLSVISRKKFLPTLTFIGHSMPGCQADVVGCVALPKKQGRERHCPRPESAFRQNGGIFSDCHRQIYRKRPSSSDQRRTTLLEASVMVMRMP